MWPYGYTYTDVPSDMTSDDHVALFAIGRPMAATNGYKPEQASDLYLTSGTTRDYAVRDLAGLLVHVRDVGQGLPDDSLISVRDRAQQGGGPVPDRPRVVPAGGPGRHGRGPRAVAPFDDDLEVARGWALDPYGTDTAPASARWNRGDPAATSRGRCDDAAGLRRVRVARLLDRPGGRVVGQRLRPRRRLDDPLDADALASSGHQRLSFRWSFAHDGHATAADSLKAIVETAGGAKTAVFTRSGSGVVAKGAGARLHPARRWHGQTIRIVFVASDLGADNLVEASLDDIRVTLPTS